MSDEIDDHQRRSARPRGKAANACRVGVGPWMQALFERVKAMQRVGSYVAAAVVIVAIAAGVSWVVEQQAGATPGAPTAEASGYRFEASPAGADGPLKRCVVCHSVEKGGTLRVAPPLYGIVGAPKARAKWYAYSQALQKAGGVWSEDDLDKFLTAPSKFLPGTAKTLIGIPDAKERADIIAALKKTG
jgi:cytochrome c